MLIKNRILNEIVEFSILMVPLMVQHSLSEITFKIKIHDSYSMKFSKVYY
jgi:hypothetical protein